MASHLGTRVLRGPNWDQGDEDGGEGHVGTVVELLSNQRVRVLWDTGQESTCRAGTDGKFDLRVFDTAPIGVRHPGTKCKECGEQNVYGVLWRCNECAGCDLCSLCYQDDKHDLRHQFLRIDFPGCEGQAVKKRKTSVKIRTLGMFSGAKVKRGRDWMWGEQDGGVGSEGEVKGYENVAPDSSRNLVRVQWSNAGPINSYRLGFQGHVDLVCVEEDLGPFYYRDHLAPLDVTKTVTTAATPDATTAESAALSGKDSSEDERGSKPNSTKRDETKERANGELSFAAGDRVAIKVGQDKLKQLQETYGGCTRGMIKAIGSTGAVTEVTSRGAVWVRFKSSRYRINPAALHKVFELTEGATVRIRPNEDEVKILNSRVGWKDNMAATLGKVGRVLKIDNDGDALISFGRQHFLFSPACCLPAPGASVDSLTLQSGHKDVTKDKVVTPQPMEGNRSSSNSKEDPQALYRVLKEAIRGDGFRSGRGDPSELLGAICEGDHVTVRRLCQADRSLVECEHSGLTPLMLACSRGQREVMQVLLDVGADVNHRIGGSKTPLGAAMEGKNEDMVELLLACGADPWFRDHKRHTYAHIAAYFNLPLALQALAASGLDVNAKDDFQDTPLHLAISKRKDASVAALVGMDCIDLCAKDRHGFGVLHQASMRGYSRAVELIVQKDKSQVNTFSHGTAPLHMAANDDHDECVRMLVLHGGADINLHDKAGASYTPLHLACIRGKFRSAEALVELGADVHVRDISGDTPLHLSIGGREVRDLDSEAGQLESHQRVAMACMLITKGAYVDVENGSGRDPLDYGVRPVRDGVKKFIKHNPSLVKRKGRESQTGIQHLGISSFDPKGRGELKEALKGVGLPCGLCGTPKSDVTLQPCQHKCVCSTCSDKVTRCPLCEEHVTDKVVTGPDEQTLDLHGCKQM